MTRDEYLNRYIFIRQWQSQPRYNSRTGDLMYYTVSCFIEGHNHPSFRIEMRVLPDEAHSYVLCFVLREINRKVDEALTNFFAPTVGE
jgi:hypothetical protein